MPSLEDEIERARSRFVAWVRWFLDNYPEKASSQNDLAEKIGVAGPTLTYLLEKGSHRNPSLPTMIGFQRFTTIPLATFLFTDPPNLRK